MLDAALRTPPPMPEAPRPRRLRPIGLRARSAAAPRRSVTDEGLHGFRDVIAETRRRLGRRPRRAAQDRARGLRRDRRRPPTRPSIASNRASSRKACARRCVCPRGRATRPRAARVPPSRPACRSIARRNRACRISAGKIPAGRAPPRIGLVGAHADHARREAARNLAARGAVRSERASSHGRPSSRGRGRCAAPSADDIDELPKRLACWTCRRRSITVLLIVGAGAAAYWQRDSIARLVNAVRGPVNQAPKDAQPTRPKINDRVGAARNRGHAGPAASANAAERGARSRPVAQRVVLYEEDPDRPAGQALRRLGDLEDRDRDAGAGRRARSRGACRP